MQNTPNEYCTHSDILWGQAQAALQEGDSIQASEKLWGSGAQAVKTVAEARGWPHNSHRDLHNVIVQLSEETGQRRLAELFAIASALHQNFYEWWMSLDEVRGLAISVQELREALFRFLEAPPG